MLEIGRGIRTLVSLMRNLFRLLILSIESTNYCVKVSNVYLNDIHYNSFEDIAKVSADLLLNADLANIDNLILRCDVPMPLLNPYTTIYCSKDYNIVTRIRIVLHFFFRKRHISYVEVLLVIIFKVLHTL